MVIRIYHARVHPGKEAEFERLVRADAVPLMKAQPGLLSLHLGREMGQPSGFVIVSVWRDLEAVKAFAGENWQQPVVLHPQADVLEEERIEHYLDFET
jgi:heme-degrading monooxygenase HmoA